MFLLCAFFKKKSLKSIWIYLECNIQWDSQLIFFQTISGFQNHLLISHFSLVYYAKFILLKNTRVYNALGLSFLFIDLVLASNIHNACGVVLANSALSILVCSFFQVVVILVVLVMVMNTDQVQIVLQALTHFILQTSLSLFLFYRWEETGIA